MQHATQLVLFWKEHILKIPVQSHRRSSYNTLFYPCIEIFRSVLQFNCSISQKSHRVDANIAPWLIHANDLLKHDFTVHFTTTCIAMVTTFSMFAIWSLVYTYFQIKNASFKLIMFAFSLFNISSAQSTKSYLYKTPKSFRIKPNPFYTIPDVQQCEVRQTNIYCLHLIA